MLGILNRIYQFLEQDWMCHIADTKSTSGYVVRLFVNVIAWKTKKQGCVKKSSTHAVYISLSEVLSELICFIGLLKDFTIQHVTPVKPYENNSSVILIVKYCNITKNSKHIETHFHFVHDNYIKKFIDVIKTSENLADTFTKSLGREKF